MTSMSDGHLTPVSHEIETVEIESEKEEAVFNSNSTRTQENVDNSSGCVVQKQGRDPKGGSPHGLLPQNGVTPSRTRSSDGTHAPSSLPTGGGQQSLAPLAQILGERQREGTIAQERVGGPRRGRSGPDSAAIPPRAETGRKSRPRGPSDDADGPVPTRRGRLPKADAIRNIMEDVSFKLHDEYPASSVTRAIRLWQASGLDEPVFAEILYRARSISRQQGGVKKRAAGGDLVNRTPYFFAVVEDLLGLRARDRAVAQEVK